MKTFEENDVVEHTIEIDEYASAILKIPKRLSSIELKALMVKANKLFNLSEVPMVRRPYRKSIDEDVREDGSRINAHETFTQEQIKTVIESYDNGLTASMIADKLGIDRVKVSGKINYLKKLGKIGRRNKESKIDKIEKLLKKGFTHKEIAEKIGSSNKRVLDSVYYLKRVGRIK